jgi:uncharacterized protein (TIGR02598 family)
MISPRFHFEYRQAPSRAGRGFTLVEVLLALGIVSFAFMALCGMLPVGLKTYRDAMDATCRANIVRVVSAELAQSPYTTINATLTNTDKDRYFSDQGLVVTNAADARFCVKYVNVLSETMLFGATNSSLKPVTIEISAVQGGRSLSRVTVFVADNGISTNGL